MTSFNRVAPLAALVTLCSALSSPSPAFGSGGCYEFEEFSCCAYWQQSLFEECDGGGKCPIIPVASDSYYWYLPAPVGYQYAVWGQTQVLCQFRWPECCDHCPLQCRPDPYDLNVHTSACTSFVLPSGDYDCFSEVAPGGETTARSSNAPPPSNPTIIDAASNH